MFDVLIKNGKTEREQPIEIGINGSQIAALAPKLEGASGKQEIDLHHEAYVSAGAGFVVALTGAVMTMPGLPKVPAANNIDVTDDGKITGLF